MALDVKNIDGTDTGEAKNGAITVKANRNTSKQRDASQGNVTYTIAKFDQQADSTLGTGDPTDAAKLSDRIDDPRYYQGDTPS